MRGVFRIGYSETRNVSGMLVASLIGKRDSNQDFSCCDEIGDLRIGVLCDGMGGLANGEEASKRAAEGFVRKLKKAAKKSRSRFDSEEFRFLAYGKIIHKCHEMVETISDTLGSSGTTMTAIVVSSGENGSDFVDIINIGDTRCYRLEEGSERPQLLTDDHTVTGDLVRSNSIEIHEVPLVHGNNVLNRFLGKTGFPEADVFFHSWSRGDKYLLCSDGVWGPLHDEVGIWMPENHLGCEDLASRIVKESIDRGSDDNCSAIVVSLGSKKLNRS